MLANSVTARDTVVLTRCEVLSRESESLRLRLRGPERNSTEF
jgi:hypothetical protein